MSETKFKVGDRVRVISLNEKANDGSFFKAGDIGTIISLDGSDYYVRFDKPHHYSNGFWRVTFDQLELLDSSKPSSEPNAHLIAAAPDMYEALENLLKGYLQGAASGDWGFWDYENEPMVLAAKSALAKARGEA